MLWGGAEPLIIHVDHFDDILETYVWDKTWQEVHDAFMSDIPVFAFIDDSDPDNTVFSIFPINNIHHASTEWSVSWYDAYNNGSIILNASSANGYLTGSWF